MRFGLYYRTGVRNRLFAAIAVVVAVAVARLEKRKYCRSSGLCPLSPASLCLAIDLPCSKSPSFGPYLEGSMLQYRYVLCANVDEGDTVENRYEAGGRGRNGGERKQKRDEDQRKIVMGDGARARARAVDK